MLRNVLQDMITFNSIAKIVIFVVITFTAPTIAHTKSTHLTLAHIKWRGQWRTG